MSEQPMPVSGREDVPEYAERQFREMLARRVEKGVATYGTRLQTFNGRSAIRDAQEEAIDLWQYLCQIDLESRDAQAPRPLARQGDCLPQLMGCLALSALAVLVALRRKAIGSSRSCGRREATWKAEQCRR